MLSQHGHGEGVFFEATVSNCNNVARPGLHDRDVPFLADEVRSANSKLLSQMTLYAVLSLSLPTQSLTTFLFQLSGIPKKF